LHPNLQALYLRERGKASCRRITLNARFTTPRTAKNTTTPSYAPLFARTASASKRKNPGASPNPRVKKTGGFVKAAPRISLKFLLNQDMDTL
jgi:hypothetical protein